MNETLPGMATKYRYVPVKAPASIRANSECVSNEIDESELQYEEQHESRI
jgi:hypothetical protein